MTLKPHLTTQLPPSSNSLEAQSISSGWFRRVTRRLSIGDKINCGYALALGIAVLGTGAGLQIGNYYNRQARYQIEIVQEQEKLLTDLQLSVVNFRPVADFVPVLSQPKEFEKKSLQFNEGMAKVDALMRQLRKVAPRTNIEGLEPFLEKYEDAVKEYSQKFVVVLKQISPPLVKPEEVSAAKQLLTDFLISKVCVDYYDISKELSDFIEAAQLKEQEATFALDKVETLRSQIIIASMLLSVAIAAISAIYTSRAIARPIKATTKIAEQVTQEANFNLQIPVTTEDEIGVLATSLNLLILKVSRLLEEQKAEAQQNLMQTEKMSSLGRMLAGVAHEINNPINFVYGNTIHAGEYVQELLDLLETYQAENPNPPQAVADLLEEIDIEFIKKDLPKLLESMKFGAERARAIVLSLKDFSRLDETNPNSVDLHACIESTLLILNNRLKNSISVVRNYGEIPTIEGFAGLLYQVLMNLISNAIDALEETKHPKNSGLIAITTQRLDENWVVVRIADNGCGIATEHQAKIFDAFFTTKPRGVGTGLGLSISHQIVVEKHGGKLSCQSEIGVGTSFAIALPIKHKPVAAVTVSPLISHLA